MVAYRELRRLELEILKVLYPDNLPELDTRINVDRFYGIELHEFPTQIAQLALWLCDHQMNQEASFAFGRIVMVAEIVHLRDEFGQQRMREGTYLPGEIDGRWSDAIEEDFAGWVLDRADELPVPVEKMQDLLKSRTW